MTILMKTAYAIARFGNKNKVAKALKINRSAITQWGNQVPKLRAYEIEEILQKENISKKNSKVWRETKRD